MKISLETFLNEEIIKKKVSLMKNVIHKYLLVNKVLTLIYLYLILSFASEHNGSHQLCPGLGQPFCIQYNTVLKY